MLAGILSALAERDSQGVRLKILKKNGWYIERVHGSHHILKHDKIMQTIVLPLHNTDMKPGILHSILRDAGLK